MCGELLDPRDKSYNYNYILYPDLKSIHRSQSCKHKGIHLVWWAKHKKHNSNMRCLVCLLIHIRESLRPTTWWFWRWQYKRSTTVVSPFPTNGNQTWRILGNPGSLWSWHWENRGSRILYCMFDYQRVVDWFSNEVWVKVPVWSLPGGSFRPWTINDRMILTKKSNWGNPLIVAGYSMKIHQSNINRSPPKQPFFSLWSTSF